MANKTSAPASATSSDTRYFGASVGATASANVEETAPWVERQTATGQRQHNGGVRWSTKGGWKVACGVVAVSLWLVALPN